MDGAFARCAEMAHNMASITKSKRRYGTPNPTAFEIAAAIEAFLIVVDNDVKLLPLHRGAIAQLRVDSPRSHWPRRRLGRLLINCYRRDTGDLSPVVVNGPRWSAFVAWIKSHMAEITFMRLIVALLMLLLMF